MQKAFTPLRRTEKEEAARKTRGIRSLRGAGAGGREPSPGSWGTRWLPPTQKGSIWEGRFKRSSSWGLDGKTSSGSELAGASAGSVR